MEKYYTIKTLLKLAISAEDKTRLFYKNIAKKFANNKEASQFWKLMEQDEIEHIKSLNKIYESLDENKKKNPVDKSILNKAQNCFNKVNSINLSDIVQVIDAYIITNEIENAEINTVFMFIMNEVISSKQQVKFAYEELSKHLERLKTAKDQPWINKVT